MTGTSQAAPHVSGVVAQLLERMPFASVAEIKTALISTAAQDVVKDPMVSRYVVLLRAKSG